MSWLEGIFSQFEDNIGAMCLEMNGMMRQQQEGFEYMENRLQALGAGVKKFCSDYVQEILPQRSKNSVAVMPYGSFLAQNTAKANVLSKEGMDEDQMEEEPCNTSQSHHSLPQDSEKARRNCFSVQHIIDLENWMKENPDKEKQLQPEILDSEVASHKKDPSLSVLSPTSNDLLESSIYKEEEKQLEIEMLGSVTSDKEDPSLSVLSPTPDDLVESSSWGEKQLHLELSDTVTSDKEDPSLLVSSPTLDVLLESSSRTKMIPLGFSSSHFYSSEGEVLDTGDTSGASDESVGIHYSSEGEVLDLGDTSGASTESVGTHYSSEGEVLDLRDTSSASVESVGTHYSFESEALDLEDISSSPAESIGKSHYSFGDVSNAESSYEMELGGSCIIVDSGELSSLSDEARAVSSHKEKLESLTAEKEGAAKKDADKQAACPRSESCKQEGAEGPVSSSVTTSNHELCESDWVMV